MQKQPARPLQGGDHHAQALCLCSRNMEMGGTPIGGSVFQRPALLASSPSPGSHTPRLSGPAGLGESRAGRGGVQTRSDRQRVRTHSRLSATVPDNRARWQRLPQQLLPALELPGAEHRLSTGSRASARAIDQTGAPRRPPPRPLPFWARRMRAVLHFLSHRMADLIKSPTLIMLGRGVEFQ